MSATVQPLFRDEKVPRRKKEGNREAPPPVAYAELQVSSNFSFLRGASHPEELAVTAAALGHAALAVADRNSLAGVVRAHIACRQAGIRLVVGARLDLTDGPSLLCFPTDRAAYGRLSKLLTVGRRRAPKGECHLGRADVAAARAGQIFVVLPPEPSAATAPDPALDVDGAFARQLSAYRGMLGDRLYLAAHHLYRGDDGKRLARLAALAEQAGLPLVATNDVHCHAAERRHVEVGLEARREAQRGRIARALEPRHGVSSVHEVGRVGHGAAPRLAEIAIGLEAAVRRLAQHERNGAQVAAHPAPSAREHVQRRLHLEGCPFPERLTG